MAQFGSIVNPQTISNTDNTETFGMIMGKSGEVLVAEARGKYYTPSYRGSVFAFSVAAATLPVNATTLASKFSVVNPVGSNKNLELIRLDWAYVVATTAVNGLGLYYSTPVQTAGSTLTTPATPICLNFALSTISVATAYSALTTVGTPVLAALCGYTGAVTSSASAPNSYNFDGTVIVPPGWSIHVANTTAASTASGFTGMLTWAEHPL